MMRSTICSILIAMILLAAGTPGQVAAQTGDTRRGEGSRDRITTRQEFNDLARTILTGGGEPMPHVMFVIDRADGNRVYFVDSRKYRFHRDFVNARYLSLERGTRFYESNYSNPARRFILGTIAYQITLEGFTFEFYVSDRVEADLVDLTRSRLASTFFERLAFKANTDEQLAAAKRVKDLEIVRANEIFENDAYLALHTGKAFGVLRVLDRVSADTVVDRNEIVILKEPPVHISPVSGIINAVPPSPLSHLNVLARSWNVPNIYARDVEEIYKDLIGKYVYLEATRDRYVLRLADTKELVEVTRRQILESELATPKADLSFTQLSELSSQRAHDSIRFGAKSANLGELIAADLDGFDVPAGFTIPFSYYSRFIKETGIDAEIFECLDDQRFNHDVEYRRERLARLRDRIVEMPISTDMKDAICGKARKIFAGAGLFVRSSTNAEDLPNFSGAGLYTTVPNVKGDEALCRAVKAVWASIWNERAYAARQEAGMSHLVYPAVLVQRGMEADSAGVMITSNPFDPDDTESVYINAKRGLGIRVVDGHKVAEQILIHAKTKSVRVLTRSADDTALTFDPDGGIREIRIEPGRRVLDDELASRLARIAREIERWFAAGPLDIEWLTIGDHIYIVQVRPFR